MTLCHDTVRRGYLKSVCMKSCGTSEDFQTVIYSSVVTKG